METEVDFSVNFTEAQLTMAGKIYSKEYYDKIFSEIAQLSTSMEAEKIELEIQKRINLTILLGQNYNVETLSTLNLFRLRVMKENEIADESKTSSFSYPPNVEMIKEKGRANLEGQQVFYAAADKHTPFVEMANEISEGSSIGYLSKWGIMPTPEPVFMRNLFLGIPPDDDKNFASIMAQGTYEVFEKILNGLPDNYKENFVYGQKKYAEIFRNKGKELYHISSTIANATFVTSFQQGADIPIITYPSVAKGEKAVNFAIRKDFADKYLYLKEVYMVKINKVTGDNAQTEIIKRGYYEDGVLKWTLPHIKAVCKTAFISPDGEINTMRNVQSDESFMFAGDTRKYKLNELLHSLQLDGLSFLDLAAKNVDIGAEYTGPMQAQALVPVKFTDSALYLNSDSTEEIKVNYLMLPVSYTFSYVEPQNAG